MIQENLPKAAYLKVGHTISNSNLIAHDKKKGKSHEKASEVVDCQRACSDHIWSYAGGEECRGHWQG